MHESDIRLFAHIKYAEEGRGPVDPLPKFIVMQFIADNRFRFL
jgi:hypothetical protein